MAELIIDPLFCGPADSANGGYACGCLAEMVTAEEDQCVRVNLRAPPPLGTAMDFERGNDGSARLLHIEEGTNTATLVAEADALTGTLELLTPPTFELAGDYAEHYSGFEQHALPYCFVCGPKRAPKEGLRIFPGRPPQASGPDKTLVAAPWTPHKAFASTDGSISPRLIWAALDCPGYFAVAQPGELALLASMTAKIESTPTVDEPCVVIGWSLGREGRKLRAATAAFGRGGRVLGWSEQLWIKLRPRS